MCNMERIGIIASEEMSFENVDGRTTNACIYFGSVELISVLIHKEVTKRSIFKFIETF